MVRYKKYIRYELFQVLIQGYEIKKVLNGQICLYDANKLWMIYIIETHYEGINTGICITGKHTKDINVCM